MSIFASAKRVTVNPGGQGRSYQAPGITLLIRDDLSVEGAMVYQKRYEEHEGDSFELGIDLLLAYVEGWEVDGADSAAPFDEATLRRVKLSVFEALVLAVSGEISPEEPEDSENPSPNA